MLKEGQHVGIRWGHKQLLPQQLKHGTRTLGVYMSLVERIENISYTKQQRTAQPRTQLF